MSKKTAPQKQSRPEQHALIYVRVDPRSGESHNNIHRRTESQRYFGIGLAHMFGAAVIATHIEIGPASAIEGRPILQEMLQSVEAERDLLIIAENDSILADSNEIGPLRVRLDASGARLMTLRRLTRSED